VLLPTDNKLYVLNPARRELLTLPESIGRVHDHSSFCRGSVGFGHDPSTNMYKVVQCFRQRSSDDGLGDYITGMEVFTIDDSTTPRWRDVFPPCPVHNRRNATFFKGSLFWLLRERDRLLRFCLRAETFSFTVHPPCPPGLDLQNFNLSELDGELCLAHHESSPGVLTIWMTKDGVNPQWHRRYVLNVEPCFTMAISPYGLLLKKHDYTIVQYNFRNNKVDDVASLEDLRYQGFGTHTVEFNKGENLFFIEMIPYTQSLVSLTNAR
jgi:F-box interacting protein